MSTPAKAAPAVADPTTTLLRRLTRSADLRVRSRARALLRNGEVPRRLPGGDRPKNDSITPKQENSCGQ
jgi:hypothetical protein